VPSEGSSTHCLAQAKKREIPNHNETAKNPARTWRQGKAAEVFKAESASRLYPDGKPGQQSEPPKKSRRVRSTEDKAQEGEFYTGQVDAWTKVLRDVAPDCPGVLAGQSTSNRLPKLTGGHLEMGANYAWAPLARTLRLGIG